MNRRQKNALFDVLDQHFDLGEIEQLCFRLDVDRDNLGGAGKSALIRELIAKIQRAGGNEEVQLPELVAEAQALRPGLDWSAVFPTPAPSVPAPSQAESGTQTLLVLSANPAATARLRLDKEIREIDEGLRRARQREQFKLVSRWAVRPLDLRRALLEEKPAYVHFCGHGEGEDGLFGSPSPRRRGAYSLRRRNDPGARRRRGDYLQQRVLRRVGGRRGGAFRL